MLVRIYSSNGGKDSNIGTHAGEDSNTNRRV